MFGIIAIIQYWCFGFVLMFRCTCSAKSGSATTTVPATTAGILGYIWLLHCFHQALGVFIHHVLDHVYQAQQQTQQQQLVSHNFFVVYSIKPIFLMWYNRKCDHS